MVGMFFARASRCSRNSFSSTFRNFQSNASKSQLKFRRRTPAFRQNPSAIFALNCRLNALEQSLAAQITAQNKSPNGLLLKIQSSGLHTTSCLSVDPNQVEDVLATVTDGDNSITDIVSGFGCNEATVRLSQTRPLSSVNEDIFTSHLENLPLSELGLGGYTPVGMVQQLLDFLHATVGMPWWCSIIAGTFALRMIVFPLMVKGQVNTARLSKIKPELDKLQEKLRDLSNLQNPMMKAQASMELQELFKKNDCHPAKAIISPLVQLPLFISFFLALRQMANLPVESLRTGGVLWFPDLSAADPFYVLPVLTAATMLLTIETGADAGMSNPQMKNMKNVFRGMCFIMVPLTYNFPTAIFLYWITTNALSLVQVTFMKIPSVRTYFGLPDPAELAAAIQMNSAKQGSFMENFRAGFKSAQEAAQVKHEESMRKKMYEDSLKSSTYKETFDYNPVVQQNKKLFSEASKKKR